MTVVKTIQAEERETIPQHLHPRLGLIPQLVCVKRNPNSSYICYMSAFVYRVRGIRVDIQWLLFKIKQKEETFNIHTYQLPNLQARPQPFPANFFQT